MKLFKAVIYHKGLIHEGPISKQIKVFVLENGINEEGEKSRQMTLSALCSNENNESSQCNKKGISLEDYYKIFSVLTHIDDVDKVFYN